MTQATDSILERRVAAIVVEKLGADKEDVNESASFVNDLKADSLDIVELVMALEEEFKVEISDEAAAGIKNVRDVVVFLREHGIQS
ncbi:MAG: acyl carrier protein [Candidatus Wildermuthbacteria bacterium RIFCSPHIGHO2_12_FULL_45_9]|uniref:Acyl carrier protein n=1 Tax=Candidatus Wildermuthbacteria bacterium RIFCSPHIGHO2_02_FULL_45_25 TaxID=1802450 RepID=A0A1G2R363_9BACT|nr:MAG: acyl carrier protein [Candidatus Wildermuthbacteria bacterium RIFCSPHIGHO2_01_FULL_45_20]OHA67305.1 MAG: acyl carrier protein [Candidatus Wildermuthbacteria bacterium RIFCSPHIGHO2_02_FULL_45_25]OHA71125.1 MAG: acyl carrier protein [Candidatus Wildermuthbacteria bacterium RIFCSPHIGHO2_12_FULL_45_9]